MTIGRYILTEGCSIASFGRFSIKVVAGKDKGQWSWSELLLLWCLSLILSLLAVSLESTAAKGSQLLYWSIEIALNPWVGLRSRASTYVCAHYIINCSLISIIELLNFNEEVVCLRSICSTDVLVVINSITVFTHKVILIIRLHNDSSKGEIVNCEANEDDEGEANTQLGTERVVDSIGDTAGYAKSNKYSE